MAAAQAAARRAVEAIERQAGERTDAGLELEGLPDLSADGERDGFYQAQLIRELAVRHVTSWSGVQFEGGPAPPTPENIAAVMEPNARARPAGGPPAHEQRLGVRYGGRGEPIARALEQAADVGTPGSADAGGAPVPGSRIR
jgi:hypothetical protein